MKSNYPKIGIRPTIDGRQGGVRESLEEKTMALAKAVAELITTNLRNGDGSPVECVIADTTIGRVAESAACAEKFEREGVGSTITVTSCWCYGSETMDMNPHYPKAVWGFNGTERPGAVYLAAVLAARSKDKRYSGDNRLIPPKSSYRRGGLAPRCRLVTSWPYAVSVLRLLMWRW